MFPADDRRLGIELLKPLGEFVLGQQVVHCETDPAGKHEKDDYNKFLDRIDIQLPDFHCGLDSEDDADNPNDKCNHN